MRWKLTITVDDEIYRGLHEQVGRGHISAFIEELVHPHIAAPADSAAGYRDMAADEEHDREAREWAEGLIGEEPHSRNISSSYSRAASIGASDTDCSTACHTLQRKHGSVPSGR